MLGPAEMDDMVDPKTQCPQEIMTGASAIEMTTDRCAHPHLAVDHEACGLETGVATGTMAATAVDHEPRLVDTEAQHHLDVTPTTTWVYRAEHHTRYLTFRSWFSAKDSLGQCIPFWTETYD